MGVLSIVMGDILDCVMDGEGYIDFLCSALSGELAESSLMVWEEKEMYRLHGEITCLLQLVPTERKSSYTKPLLRNVDDHR